MIIINMKSIGFIILRHVSNKYTDQYWKLSYESIRKKYPENHTNKDDFNLVTNKGLTESFEVIKRIIDVLEFGIYPKSKILGEPNLGRRGLYSSISQKNEAEFPNKNYLYDDSRVRTNLIAFSDGITNFFKIATLLKVPLDKLLKEYEVLRKAKILE